MNGGSEVITYSQFMCRVWTINVMSWKHLCGRDDDNYDRVISPTCNYSKIVVIYYLVCTEFSGHLKEEIV